MTKKIKYFARKFDLKQIPQSPKKVKIVRADTAPSRDEAQVDGKYCQNVDATSSPQKHSRTEPTTPEKGRGK